MKISETVQSQQFKRWFGDWLNDPAHASKVVNADGTPKVVYHGTNAKLTVFNSSDKYTVHDTLVAGDVAALVQDGITQRPLAIPLSVITKASGGKDISHSIKRGKLTNLASGIKNAPIVIVNPSRNAIVYVTSIKQSGAPILVAFDMDTVFDGDEVHKATSIHLQINVQSMLDNLPQNATVYVQNENELAAVGATNNLRGLAANVKFISDASIAKQGGDVNQKHSRELETVEELKQQNELLKKQGDRRKAWRVRLAGSCGTCRRQPGAQRWKEGKKRTPLGA